MDNLTFNRMGADRIGARQVDELIGLARGLTIDNVITKEEAEFLEKWLVVNLSIVNHPLLRALYYRVKEALADTVFDEDEAKELFVTLSSLSARDFELGEQLKSCSLPLCDPAPVITTVGSYFTFTGTFVFGQRKLCERAVTDRGGLAGNLTTDTRYLVIGAYATESWKHSTFGNKIVKACEWRSQGRRISIVSERHWETFIR